MTGSKFSFNPAAAAKRGLKGVVKKATAGPLEVVPTLTVTQTDSEDVHDAYVTLAEAAAADVPPPPPPPPPPGPPPRPSRRSLAEVGAGEESPVEDGAGKEDGSVCKPSIAKANSNVSEVTHETMAETVASNPSNVSNSVAEVPSASSTATDNGSSPAVSHTLTLMMRERISAIDNIRTLLENERQSDDDLRAEFTGKVKALEKSVASKKKVITNLQTEVQTLTSKNEEYSNQLGRLGKSINELVQSNHGNIARMAELEKEVAMKDDEIERLGEDILEKTLAFDKSNEESASLVGQLAAFKAENGRLKSTVEGLQSKNGDYATELENLMASLREVVEQNTSLEGQVEDLMLANTKLEREALLMTKKDDELLDVVEELTNSLTEAQDTHKQEVAKLSESNQTLKAKLSKEKEANATTVQGLEQILEDTTTQMTDQLVAQKASYEKKIALLAKELDEAKAARKQERVKNARLQDRVAEASRAAAAASNFTSGSLAMLEQDLQEEFQIASQLKRDMEGLKQRSVNEDNDAFADEMEDLLSSLRKIQCWQLSHFQRINKLGGGGSNEVPSVDATA